MTPTPKRRWSRFSLPTLFVVIILANSGCIILDKQTVAMLMQFEARQIAHSRLMVLAFACLMMVPACGWAGLSWSNKKFSLRSILILMTIESVLLGAFVGLRAFFD